MTWYHIRDKALGGGISYVLPTQMEKTLANELLRDGIFEWFMGFVAQEILRQTYVHSQRLDDLILEEKCKLSGTPKTSVGN